MSTNFFVLVSKDIQKPVCGSADEKDIGLAYLVHQKLYPQTEFEIVKTFVVDRNKMIRLLTKDIEIN